MNVPITHEQIARRIQEIEAEKDAAIRPIMAKRRKERESLQETCGAMGHFWVKAVAGSDPDFHSESARWVQACLYCEKVGKRDAR